nr:immunoglobulin light chain junction region [Macaca mulatta]MOX27041.1 immunoglobulin light chain junction region [Macaca mulatta]MOX27540.1 immunoglobulin light chain junction region [Macaca mulatta]
CQQGDIAPFTF